MDAGDLLNTLGMYGSVPLEGHTGGRKREAHPVTFFPAPTMERSLEDAVDQALLESHVKIPVPVPLAALDSICRILGTRNGTSSGSQDRDGPNIHHLSGPPLAVSHMPRKAELEQENSMIRLHECVAGAECGKGSEEGGDVDGASKAGKGGSLTYKYFRWLLSQPRRSGLSNPSDRAMVSSPQHSVWCLDVVQ